MSELLRTGREALIKIKTSPDPRWMRSQVHTEDDGRERQRERKKESVREREHHSSDLLSEMCVHKREQQMTGWPEIADGGRFGQPTETRMESSTTSYAFTDNVESLGVPNNNPQHAHNNKNAAHAAR